MMRVILTPVSMATAIAAIIIDSSGFKIYTRKEKRLKNERIVQNTAESLIELSVPPYLTTHNSDLAQRMDRVVTLQNGRI